MDSVLGGSGLRTGRHADLCFSHAGEFAILSFHLRAHVGWQDHVLRFSCTFARSGLGFLWCTKFGPRAFFCIRWLRDGHVSHALDRA